MYLCPVSKTGSCKTISLIDPKFEQKPDFIEIESYVQDNTLSGVRNLFFFSFSVKENREI